MKERDKVKPKNSHRLSNRTSTSNTPIKSSKNIHIHSLKSLMSGGLIAVIAWLITASITSNTIFKENYPRRLSTSPISKSSFALQSFWSTDYKYNPHVRIGYLGLYSLFKFEELLNINQNDILENKYEFNEVINNMNEKNTLTNEYKTSQKENKNDNENENDTEISKKKSEDNRKKMEKNKIVKEKVPTMEIYTEDSIIFKELKEKLVKRYNIDYDSFFVEKNEPNEMYKFNKFNNTDKFIPSASYSIDSYLTQAKIVPNSPSILLDRLQTLSKYQSIRENEPLKTSGGWASDEGFEILTGSNKIQCDLPIYFPSDFDFTTSPPTLINKYEKGFLKIMKFEDIFNSAFIIKNATNDWLAQFNWQKNNFVKKYGNYKTRYGSEASIVFSGGHAEVPSTIHQLIQLIEREGVHETQNSEEGKAQVEVSHKGDTFLFDTTILGSIPELWNDFKIPEHFRDWDSIKKEEDKEMWHMLSLAPSRNGLPSHNHGKTWISVVYGKKRWFFYPPGYGPPKSIDKFSHPAQPVVQWLGRVYPKLIEGGYPKPPIFPQSNVLKNNREYEKFYYDNGHLETPRHPLYEAIQHHKNLKSIKKESGYRPLECVQEAGDIMYLPSMWTHTTLNVGDTIAIGGQQSLNDMERFEISSNSFKINPENFEALKDIGLAYYNSATNYQEQLKQRIQVISRMKKVDVNVNHQYEAEKKKSEIIYKVQKSYYDNSNLNALNKIDVASILSFRSGGGLDVDTTFVNTTRLKIGEPAYPYIFRNEYSSKKYEFIENDGFKEDSNIFVIDDFQEFIKLYVDSLDSFFVFEYSNSTYYTYYQQFKEAKLRNNREESEIHRKKFEDNHIIQFINEVSYELLDLIEINIVILLNTDLKDEYSKTPLNPLYNLENFYNFYHFQYLEAKENIMKMRDPNNKIMNSKNNHKNLLSSSISSISSYFLSQSSSISLKFYRGITTEYLQKCKMNEFIERVGPRKNLYIDRYPCDVPNFKYEYIQVPFNFMDSFLKREKVKMDFARFMLYAKYLQIINKNLDISGDQRANYEETITKKSEYMNLLFSLEQFCRVNLFNECLNQIAYLKANSYELVRKIDTFPFNSFGQLLDNKEIFDGNLESIYNFDDKMYDITKNDALYAMLYMVASHNATLSSISTVSGKVKIHYLESLQYFKKALAVKPLHPETIIMTCELLGSIDALDEMRKLVKTTENNYDVLDRQSISSTSIASLYHKLGTCFTSRGLYEDSLPLFQKSISALETFLPAHRDIVHNYYQLEDTKMVEEALIHYKRIAQIVHPGESFYEFDLMVKKARGKNIY